MGQECASDVSVMLTMRVSLDCSGGLVKSRVFFAWFAARVVPVQSSMLGRRLESTWCDRKADWQLLQLVRSLMAESVQTELES